MKSCHTFLAARRLSACLLIFLVASPACADFDLELGDGTPGRLGVLEFSRTCSEQFFGCRIDAPVVRGAQLRLAVYGSGSAKLAQASVVSDSPDTLAVDSTFCTVGSCELSVQAVAAGFAVIRVLGHDGDIIDELTLEVRAADDIAINGLSLVTGTAATALVLQGDGGVRVSTVVLADGVRLLSDGAVVATVADLQIAALQLPPGIINFPPGPTLGTGTFYLLARGTGQTVLSIEVDGLNGTQPVIVLEPTGQAVLGVQ